MSGLDEGSPARRGFWNGKRVSGVLEATRIDDVHRRVLVEYEDGTAEYVILTGEISEEFYTVLNPFR